MEQHPLIDQAEAMPELIFQGLQAGQWLNLEDLPSSFAHNQALLLCQLSPYQWLTWIPEHGEYLLNL